jgi:hypothetical protein
MFLNLSIVFIKKLALKGRWRVVFEPILLNIQLINLKTPVACGLISNYG